MKDIDNKVGYLNDNFKIFHLRDKKDIKFNAGKQTLQKGKYNTFYFIGNQKNKPEMKCIVSVDAMSYDTAEL